MERQRPNGEWLQEGIEGAFGMTWFVPPVPPFLYVSNGGSMISYPNYKFAFSIKALGMFSRMFGSEEIDF